MYNKLRRSNIPGPYFAVGHPDVMYDLKAGTAANNWTEVLKYTNAGGVFANQIQSYGGFGWIESSNITINTDAGNGNVDTYHTIFMGYNALGLAVSASVPLTTTLIGGTDKLDRFLHIGWKAILAYGIVDTNAVWLLTSASTVGSNA
jgi:N4-gp56 family major capsid protein